MNRTVFFLSDRTGITAETLGRSLLTQFEKFHFRQINWPFLDTLDKAEEAVRRINRAAYEDGVRPLVFSTLVDPLVRKQIHKSRALVFDFFDTFTSPLEKELGVTASHVMGRSHGIGNYASYSARIDALNFALSNDDGITTASYPAADVILIGVSRSGKTPTCLYLALQSGILAANYPLADQDFESSKLPQILEPYRDKLFGLTIDPERLQQIRSERRPDSRYARIEQCAFEVQAVEKIFRQQRIPYLNTSFMSVEEIATTILHEAVLERRLHG